MSAPIVVADPPGLARAAAALASGAVIGVPTDTVYGLGALPALAGATDKIFDAKRRPRDLVLPVLVADQEQAAELSQAVPPAAERLMARYWPGPLTIVLARSPASADYHLGEGAETVGLRCPDDERIRELCRLCGPLATTSANRHGQPPLTTATAVAETFAADVALVLDGGTCEGEPSTVIDCTGDEPRLIRAGRVPWSELEQSFGGSPP